MDSKVKLKFCAIIQRPTDRVGVAYAYDAPAIASTPYPNKEERPSPGWI